MKTLLFLALLSLPVSLSAQRNILDIDFGWRFHPGEIENGQSDDTDYTSWRTLDIPHDWSIEGQYDRKNPGGGSYAFLPAGIGWYKYEFEADPAWSGKAVAVEFDGIFCNSTVWINGHELGYRPNGYLGIGYDLTNHLVPGRNLLTVRVDNSRQPAARWYSGSGIYRHARLIVTDKIRVARNGTFVTTPSVSPGQALVLVQAEIRNESGAETTVDVTSIIRDAAGRECARSRRTGIRLRDNTLFSGERDCTPIGDSLRVPQPQLWSPDTPQVYYLTTEISREGRVLDRHETRFGIREATFDAEKGFRLNGKPMKFKGVCLHQNTGPVGTAMPLDLWHKRLAQLKEMGCNAIRTSHYAYAPEFYALCDTMGFMVMDELFDGWYQWEGHGKARYDYGYYFLNWWERDLEEFIRRDRNHPSVMIWSLGNEVWGYERHQYLQYRINETFHRLDPTRPTTQAWAPDLYLDIAGFNGNGEQIGDLEQFHEKQPRKVAIGTELPHTRQTRGVYQSVGSFKIWDKPPKLSEKELARRFPLTNLTQEEIFTQFDPRYASSYDNQARWICVREQWKRTRRFDFFVGEFRWTAFDYLGESWGWPARTNNYGIIDLCGFPKDHYYLYQSLWSDRPMVHLLPHWTWPGMEGTEIPVVVYTNGDEAELFFNGKSLGRKPMSDEELQIVWMVPYRPGTLTAVAYRGGKQIARKSVSTAGHAAAVRLIPDRRTLHAKRRDVVCVTVDITDVRGVPVPNASNRVDFEIAGPYKLLGVENGDILDTEPQKVLTRKAFMGKALLMLQATGEAGTLRIKATSPGLKPHVVNLNVIPDAH